jgi:hypothetical protein
MAGKTYRIRIRSHLDDRWTSWFEEMTIQRLPGGETLLTGDLPDQAALYGTLMKLRDLGLTLVAVEPVADRPEENL